MLPSRSLQRFSVLLPTILLLYTVCVIVQASLKVIWGDELFTYYIAKTGSAASIWHALAAGADPNPPLMHLAVLWSTSLFGNGPLALRIPSILCVGLALLSMWFILRRLVPREFCALGLLAFMATRGFDYSYDARSYGPMMGFSLLSLAFWFACSPAVAQGQERKRFVLLACMALALVAGLFSNYYCVLAFFPIAAGQLTLDLGRRRLDLPVWTTLFLAALPLFTLLPLIRHNISEFGPHAWNRPHASMISLSYVELVEGILWPTLAVALFALFRRSRTLGIPAPARAALLTLLLYPFLGYAVAIGGAGMISPRCVAPVCCGVGLLAGIAAAQAFPASRRAQQLAVCLLVVWFVARESVCGVLLHTQRKALFALRDEAANLDQGRPILVADSSLVLPLYFYSSAETAQRIVFPVDFKLIHREQADDSGEQNLWAGRYGVFPFPVVPFAGVASTPRALVVARPDGWLAHALERTGGHLQATAPQAAWDEAGGVFSPLTHPETRFLLLSR